MQVLESINPPQIVNILQSNYNIRRDVVVYDYCKRQRTQYNINKRYMHIFIKIEIDICVPCPMTCITHFMIFFTAWLDLVGEKTMFYVERVKVCFVF